VGNVFGAYDEGAGRENFLSAKDPEYIGLSE
jgi:hypothetical protein